MTSDLYRQRRFQQRSGDDADQAEFAAIIRTSAVVDAAIYDDRIAGALDDFEPQGIEADADWHQQDLRIDLAVGRVQEEIERRVSILGDAYPFELRGNEIRYRPSFTGVYEFCLATSCAPNITAGAFVKLPRVFERVTTLIVQRYLGDHTESLHTGWPRDRRVGTTFRAVMNKLNEMSGEWVWSTHPDLPDEPPNNKDEGLDFVVWKKSLDKRVGQLFIVGQCACGDDWEQKLNDLNLARLGKWFHPLAYVLPVRAFATPHFLSDGNLINAQREAGIVYDRPRLVLMAENCLKPKADDWVKPELEKLASLVLKQAS
jgi:hypothetical protein